MSITNNYITISVRRDGKWDLRAILWLCWDAVLTIRLNDGAARCFCMREAVTIECSGIDLQQLRHQISWVETSFRKKGHEFVIDYAKEPIRSLTPYPHDDEYVREKLRLRVFRSLPSNGHIILNQDFVYVKRGIDPELLWILCKEVGVVGYCCDIVFNWTTRNEILETAQPLKFGGRRAPTHRP